MKIIYIGQDSISNSGNFKDISVERVPIFIKPDTAVHNTEQPLYLPEFSKEFHYESVLIIKIHKQGKHIASKFASRYYDYMTIGLDFHAKDLALNLQSQHLPLDCARSFDSSAIVGTFLHKEIFYKTIVYNLLKNKETIKEYSLTISFEEIDVLISYVSQYFTLRTGDLLFVKLSSEFYKIVPDSTLEGFLDNEKIFSLHIK